MLYIQEQSKHEAQESGRAGTALCPWQEKSLGKTQVIGCKSKISGTKENPHWNFNKENPQVKFKLSKIEVFFG